MDFIIFCYLSLSSNLAYCASLVGNICISHIQTVALCQLLTMPVLYNNQTIKLPFDISKLDNLYQPYRYAEYIVMFAMTLVSQI